MCVPWGLCVSTGVPYGRVTPGISSCAARAPQPGVCSDRGQLSNRLVSFRTVAIQGFFLRSKNKAFMGNMARISSWALVCLSITFMAPFTERIFKT